MGNIIEDGSDGEMVYTYIKSDFSDWIYIKSQSLASITAKSNAFAARWAIITDAILTLGLLLTCLLVYKIYSPLRRLTKELMVTQQITGSGNEYAILSRAYKKMSDQQRLMRTYLEAGKNKLNNLFLTNLLKGNAENYGSEDIPEEIKFPYDGFVAAMVAIDSDISEYSSEKKNYFWFTIMKSSSEYLNKMYVCYPVMYDEDIVGVIVNMPLKCEEPNKSITSIFRDVMQSVNTELGISVSVGIGILYDSVQMVPTSAIEAEKALGRRLLTGKSSINVWNPNVKNLMKFYYPYDSEERILNALSANNLGSINNELDRLAVHIQEMPELSSNNIINIFNQLIASTIKNLIDADVNVGNIFGNINQIYTQLSAILTLDEIIGFMKTYFSKICEYRQNNLEADSYFDKIIAYLKQNYKHDINFELMAEEIGISYSYLRKIVKETTDKTVLEYLIQIRMDESKHLLIQTDMTVACVSEAVGFSNVQSFNRYFKKYVGITASEFRKTGLKDAEQNEYNIPMK